MAKSKFIELLDSFISVYIPISRGLSNNTVNSYKTTFTLFIIFLYEKKGMPADKITFEKTRCRHGFQLSTIVGIRTQMLGFY